VFGQKDQCDDRDADQVQDSDMKEKDIQREEKNRTRMGKPR